MTTKNKLIRAIKKLDPNLSQTEDAFKSALILLSATVVGTSTKNISEFTSLPIEFVKERVQRAKENEIFKNGKVNGAEWFEKDGEISFWMDVCVLDGFMNRVQS